MFFFVYLQASESKQLLSICDLTLVKILLLLQVNTVVAIGRFAEKRASLAITSAGLRHIKVFQISSLIMTTFNVANRMRKGFKRA